MSKAIRDENVRRMLELVNLQLKESGHRLQYTLEKSDDKRGNIYMLRHDKDHRYLSDWMTTKETYNALYTIYRMLPVLAEPTPYQRMMEELQALNDHLVTLGLPWRHTISGPEEGKYTLYLHDVVDGDGNAILKAQYTEEGMIKRLRLQKVQAALMVNKTEEAEA